MITATEVSIKEFQRNIYRFLDSLPIILTKRGKKFAVIQDYLQAKEKPSFGERDSLDSVATSPKPLEKIPLEFVERCKHGLPRNLCKHSDCRET